MEIDIKIDSLTNCLTSEETHEEFDTEYKLFRKTISTSQATELKIPVGFLIGQFHN